MSQQFSIESFALGTDGLANASGTLKLVARGSDATLRAAARETALTPTRARVRLAWMSTPEGARLSALREEITRVQDGIRAVDRQDANLRMNHGISTAGGSNAELIESERATLPGKRGQLEQKLAELRHQLALAKTAAVQAARPLAIPSRSELEALDQEQAAAFEELTRIVPSDLLSRLFTAALAKAQAGRADLRDEIVAALIGDDPAPLAPAGQRPYEPRPVMGVH